MRILVDVDGVCADLHGEWLRRYNEDSGDDLTPEEITGWDIARFVANDYKKKIYDYLEDPDLYDCISPIDGALAGIEFLRKQGNDILFTTHCIKGQIDSKADWLHRHGFTTTDTRHYLDEFVAVKDKSRVTGDVLIDDGLHNFKHDGIVKVLVDQPWNWKNPEHIDYHMRVYGLNDLVQRYEQLCDFAYYEEVSR